MAPRIEAASTQPSLLDRARAYVGAVRELAKPLNVLGITSGLVASLADRSRGGNDNDPPAPRAAPTAPRGPHGTGFRTPMMFPPEFGPGGINASRGGALAMRGAAVTPLAAAVNAAIATKQSEREIAAGLTVLWNQASTQLGDFQGTFDATRNATRTPEAGPRRDPHVEHPDLTRAQNAFNAELANGSPESLKMQSGGYTNEQLRGHFMKMSDQLRSTIRDVQATNPARAARYIERIPSLENYVPADTQFGFYRNGEGVLQVVLR